MKGCVLITGVHGFCAKHLVKRLIMEGVDIFGADIQSIPPESLDLKNYFRLDITDQSNVNDVICSVMPDMIFHLAGITRGEASEIYLVNLLGNVYLLEAIRRWIPMARVLLVGSAAEYGDVPVDSMPITELQLCKPRGPYGISKYAATLAGLDYAYTYGLKVAVVRPFNIIGAGMPTSLVIGAILARIKHVLSTGEQNPEVSVGNLDTQRDFIAIDDVMDVYVDIIQAECWGEIFNICSGEPRSIRSVLATLLSYSEKFIGLKVVPELIRSSDVRCSYGSIDKVQSTFGFKPKRTIEAALKDAWDYAMGVRV